MAHALTQIHIIINQQSHLLEITVPFSPFSVCLYVAKPILLPRSLRSVFCRCHLTARYRIQLHVIELQFDKHTHLLDPFSITCFRFCHCQELEIISQ